VSLPPLVSPAADLSVDEVRRYSRHLIIPDVGMTGQKRLKNAKVLCVGAGGLGSPALLYLAAAGAGTLGIIDFDVVDESNLQRQVIHGQSDVGRSKAQSARDSILEINPLVNVVLHEERLDSDNAMEIFAPYDLIVDGTDNFATRYLVNDACVLLGKPYVGLDLPVRRAGQRVLGRARAVLPVPVPRAAAAGHGAVLRRGRRPRRAVRVDRVHPGQ
jgi:adenylyltransferase/sulfurtransferase